MSKCRGIRHFARQSKPSNRPHARATGAAAQPSCAHSSPHSNGNNRGSALMPGMAKQNCSLSASQESVANDAPNTSTWGAPLALSTRPPQANTCKMKRMRLS